MKRRITGRSLGSILMGDMMRMVSAVIFRRRGLLCCVAVAFLVSGCAFMNGSVTDPNQCVGPPDFCTPFFGS